MNGKMHAVVKTRPGIGNVEHREVEIPKPGVGEVLIKVMSAGICGTDIKIRAEQTWSNPPVILGHEYAGVIETLGDGVQGLRPGQRVVSETAQVVCGTCVFCKTGRQLMCKDRLSIGYGVDGAFAQYIKVRKEIVHPIPDGVTFNQAAMCEPFAVALHGVWDSTAILPTDVVLVQGPGAIGQCAAQAARLKGATVILAGMETDAPRLDIAKQMGITHVTTRLDEALIDRLTGGSGVDIAIDCTGAERAINTAMQLLKPTGKLIQIGLTEPRLEIEYALLTGREVSIIGSFGHQWHNWHQALCLMQSGKVDLSPLATAHYLLEDWNKAFSCMERQEGVKILLHPNGFTQE